MLKLDQPTFTARDSFQKCLDGIGSPEFKDRLNAVISDLCELADTYQQNAKTGNLFNTDAIPKDADENYIVIGGLTKKEFITLYEYYFRNKQKPGRAIYDLLMVSAQEKCPYCGGIGRPKNLDHFIPKAVFPQFSTIPSNLIPSCRDCNMDNKGEEFADIVEEQIIHPYFDKDKFFSQQWIIADIKGFDPCVVEYSISPPNSWSQIDKSRVEKHFDSFEISKRYSIQAAEELSILIDQRRGFMKEYSVIQFKEYLESFSKGNYFENHWKRVMYQCLAKNNDFCNYDF